MFECVLILGWILCQDCSFEDPPPRYMCLYVLQQDRMGGGHSSLVDAEVLVRYLSRKALRVLTAAEFDMRVPAEFQKGGDKVIRGRLIFGSGLWRYRSDIIIKDRCTEGELAALAELDGLLRNPHLVLSTDLPQDSILVLDNSRWLHGRSAIFDQSRWLKRVRYHPLAPPPVLRPLITRTISLQQIEEIDVNDGMN
jgi:hypothetical protein